VTGRPRVVALVGVDGSGKTTQAYRLATARRSAASTRGPKTTRARTSWRLRPPRTGHCRNLALLW